LEAQKAEEGKSIVEPDGVADALSAQDTSAARTGSTTSRQDASMNPALTERKAKMSSDE
jgi:hypothetical protein